MGHGDHWGCFDDDIKELTTGLLLTAVKNGEVTDVGKVRTVWPGKTHEEEGTVYASDYPADTDVCFRSLHWIDQDTRTIRLVSWFPMGRVGHLTDVKIRAIREWELGLEAVIVGSTSDGAEIAFFDTPYFKNSGAYRIGEWQSFSLAGLAYSVHSAAGSHFIRDDQEQLRQWYEVMGEEPPRDAGGRILPQTVSLEGLAALVPSDGDWPEDCTYSCVVEGLDSFTVEGYKIYSIDTTFLHLEPEVGGILYAPSRVIEAGYTLKEGDTITGGLWLHGCLCV